MVVAVREKGLDGARSDLFIDSRMGRGSSMVVGPASPHVGVMPECCVGDGCQCLHCYVGMLAYRHCDPEVVVSS